MANRPEVERELAKAEVELAGLRERESALAAAIMRARYLLGIGSQPMQPVTALALDRIALHDALVVVLHGRGNAAMSARELADETNTLGLYRKRDGSPVDIGQIHARVHNYSHLFIREGGKIRLREAEQAHHDPVVLAKFDAAMLEVYDAAMREVGYPARRFLYMTRHRGGLEAARYLLAKAGVSEGFRRLTETGNAALTMEYQVLRAEFAPLFSDRERATARERLLSSGLTEEQLP
jgi:hypothetical protein